MGVGLFSMSQSSMAQVVGNLLGDLSRETLFNYFSSLDLANFVSLYRFQAGVAFSVFVRLCSALSPIVGL